VSIFVGAIKARFLQPLVEKIRNKLVSPVHKRVSAVVILSIWLRIKNEVYPVEVQRVTFLPWFITKAYSTLTTSVASRTETEN